MSRALPFTIASLARAIRGVEAAGKFVVGVKGDGTLIVADNPVNTASLVPAIEQPLPPVPKTWRERLGGQGEA